MNILKQFWNFLFPQKPKQYDFILTKSFLSKGIKKGDLVMRIEHALDNNYLCSKGRFEIVTEDNQKKLKYTFDKRQKLVQISLNNVKEVLSEHKAHRLLDERVSRVQ